MTEQQIAEYVEQGKAFNPVRFQEQQMSGNVVVGDCLDILRTWVSDESIDLVYADPPFNSGVDYGKFNDVWYWDADAEESYQQMPNGKLLDAVNAVRLVSGPDSPMAAYALFMGRRLAELHRVLKPTGSIYLHCDPKANWCLRILLDATFGRQQFRNEIVWAYTGPSSPGARQFNRKHDTLLWYAKGKQWIFNTDAVRIPHKALNTNRAGRVIADAMTEELRDKYLKQGKVPVNVVAGLFPCWQIKKRAHRLPDAEAARPAGAHHQGVQQRRRHCAGPFLWFWYDTSSCPEFK